MNFGSIWTLVKDSVNAWIDDYAPSMGAAIAYYTVFSLAPLLLIVIAVAGLVFGQEAVRGQIVSQLGGLMGTEGATAVQALLKSASEPKEGLLSSIVGVVLLVVGATTVFAELQSALDRIWRVEVAKKQNGLWNLLRTRVLSFGLVLGLGFMMMVSLVVSAALAALGAWYGGMLEGREVVLQAVNIVVSLAFSIALFAMIYKFMPRARVAWRDVAIGALVTAALFEAGKLLIGLYIGKAGVTSGFGAAGSFVVLIVWVYYSAQIFLLGAEFTWVYARVHGSHRANAAREAPADGAIPIPRRDAESAKPTAGELLPPVPHLPEPRMSGTTWAALLVAVGTMLALDALKAKLSKRHAAHSPRLVRKGA